MFTVNSVGDTGSGSGLAGDLRYCLTQANATPGPNTIQFAIPAAGVQVINLTSALPAIANSVVIDGYTQAGASPNTLATGDNAILTVELNGAAAGSGVNGLTINTGGCTIRGLVLDNFSANGILVSGTSAGGNTIEGNFIGPDSSGVSAHGNALDGILIGGGAAGNTIGGNAPDTRNIISGNGNNGVELDAPSNTIEGNYIGTDVTGNVGLGNASRGVVIQDDGETIGGTAVGAGNVISANSLEGILFYNATSGIANPVGSLVAGNTIGLGADGTTALGNQVYGVYVALDSQFVTIGGITSAARNVISSNVNFGIISDAGAAHLTIQGNYIGTDATGELPRPNTYVGIYVLSPNAVIGGLAATPAAAPGNVIAANGSGPTTGVGISLAVSANNAVVQGNIVGLDAAGTMILNNYQANGILAGSLSSLTIGGSVTGAGNIVSGNFVGIGLSSVVNSIVAGNFVGTDITGTLARGNTLIGVLLESGSANNTIGGTTAVSRNIISGNAGDGVQLTGSATMGNVVEGNFIGTDVSGTLTLGNAGEGIRLQNQGSGNLIGGATAGAGNIISANGLPPGIVSWWRADGNTFDSVSGNNGTLENGVSFAPGKSGQAFSFNGSSQFVEVPNAPALNPTQVITVEAWIDPAGHIGVSDPIVKKAGEGLQQQDGYALEFHNTNSIFFGVYVNGLGWEDSPLSAAIPLGQWTYVTGTYDGTYISLYVNGVSVGSPTFAPGGIVASGNPLEIGGDPANPGRAYDGLIDDAAVYSRVLSSAQIQAIYNTGGGAKSAAGNVNGVELDSNAAGNIIQGNFIGTTSTGAAALGNSQYGAYLNTASVNSILGNTISGNASDGVNVNGNGALPGTVSWWKAEGNANDLVGANNGTVNGAKFTTGIHGQGFSFDGVSNYVDLGSNGSLNISGSETWSGWFNIQSLPKYKYLIADFAPTNGFLSQGSLGVEPVGNGNHFYWFQSYTDGTHSSDLLGSTPVNLNQWYNVAVVRDDVAKTITLYLNGAVDGTFSYAGETAVGLQSDKFLGGAGTAFPADFFNGFMDEVSLYNRPLSAAEIQTIYQEQGTGLGGTTIQGNLIGATAAGTAGLANGGNGVTITSAAGNTIGGTTTAARNVISRNLGYGVVLTGAGASSSVVEGNYIGLQTDGATPLGNIGGGAEVAGGASANTIGGTAAGAGNVLGGVTNGDVGVFLTDPNTQSNSIAGNFFGTDSTGTHYSNAFTYDVEVGSAAQHNTIGGTAAGARNLLDASSIAVLDLASFTTIQGNYVGVDATGTQAIGNQVGINVQGFNDTISGNLISGNVIAGIGLIGSAGAQVQGNLIGTNATGTAALPNGVGILVDSGANGNTIGGTTAAARNIISGNSGDGIKFSDSGTSSNVVEGNYIGTEITGQGKVAPQGTIGWWKGEGNAIDAVGGNNGTLVGNVQFTSGEVGQAFQFDGTDYVEIPNAPALQPNTLTIDGWIKPVFAGRPVIPADHDVIFLRNATVGGSTVGYGLAIAMDPTPGAFVDDPNGVPLGTAAFFVNIGGTAIQIFSPTALPNDGKFHHVAATYDGSTMVLYVDGVAVTNQAVSGSFVQATGADAFIGHNPTNNGNSRATIDEVSLYNRALSAAEIQTIYNNGSRGKGVSNAGKGVTIAGGAANNTIGGNVAGAGNVISGNTSDGIYIGSASTTGNVVEGNLIGTNVTGDHALANQRDGVEISTCSGNRIGTNGDGVNDALERNVISGNALDGVAITTGGNNIVSGNYIGLGADGSTIVANAGSGVDIFASHDNIIGVHSGGSTADAFIADERNVISGNVNDGVLVVAYARLTGTTHNVIASNYIGTDASGTQARGNGQWGLTISSNAGGVLTGDLFTLVGSNADGLDDAIEANVISGNGFGGILFDQTSANTVAGNFIGTDYTGTVAIANGSYGGASGVYIVDGSVNITIGGTAAADRNIISGNSGAGITVKDPTTGNITIEGNYIGTDVTGSKPLGNQGAGIGLDTTSSNTIGGSVTGAGNLVSANKGNDGIAIHLGSGNVVAGNFIGTDATGTAALGNAAYGIELNATSGNTIGGISAGARNIISGNARTGVLLDQSTTTENIIEGNYIGTDVTGMVALGNSANGVELDAAGNTVGGATATPGMGAGNVISGNLQQGILVGADNNLIQGNLIGTNASGTAKLGNGVQGIWIFGAVHITVGGTVAGARNVISGNEHGIRIDNSNNQVLGNYIGMDVSGTHALGNMFNGVVLINGSNDTVGGTTAATRNVISGNGEAGIRITVGANNDLVQGNYIGTDATGTVALPNYTGVYVQSVANNTIGGATPGAGNIISGNSYSGIWLSGSGATGNLVAGNFVGTDVSGANALPNGARGNPVLLRNNGITLDTGASNNTIGGITAGARNIISGNKQSGVWITDANTSANTVEGNYIGTDASGAVALPNSNEGVGLVSAARNNTIGGYIAGAGNLISGNAFDGVAISGSGTTVNVVAGNLIGTDVSGNQALANGTNGVEIGLASDNLIGTDGTGVNDAVERNIISGNAGEGVRIDGGAGNNIVAGNYIGLGADGSTIVANGDNGVSISSGHDNIIGVHSGGTTVDAFIADERNVISGNRNNGVYVQSDGEAGSTNNVIAGNYIGTDATGTQSRANLIGVFVAPAVFDPNPGGSLTLIGTNADGVDDASEANVISGNGAFGVLFQDAGAAMVAGNFIGTDPTGTVAVGNGVTVVRGGITIRNASHDITIGGTVAAARNIISGNIGRGITVQDPNTGHLTIEGNYIGTDVTGNNLLSNQGGGVYLDAPFGVTIGGTAQAPAM
jgi:hypothetical protein